MMMPQTLKSVNFTKTQKSSYLKNETLFLLQIKNTRATLLQKNGFVAEITFKKVNFNQMLTTIKHKRLTVSSK